MSSKAHTLKELLIEWFIRTWEPGTMCRDLSLQNLEEMSSFDPHDDCTDMIYSGGDLWSALQNEAGAWKKDNSLKEVITQALKGTELLNEANALLDEELKEAGVTSLVGLQITPRKKAACIAAHRVNKEAQHRPKSASSNGQENDYDFELHLHTLIDGYGGNVQNVSLYFTLNTPFHEFQQVLRNETKLSTIPPLEIVKPDALPWSSVERSTSPELPRGGRNASDYSLSRRGCTVGENTKSRRPSISQPSSKMPVRPATQSRRPSQLLHPTTAREELGSPASKKPKSSPPWPRPRSASMKGYSLDDGPWTYRIYNTEDPRVRNPYIELNDEEGYLEIMYTLKDAIRKSPGAQHRVMFWHSADLTAINKYTAKAKREHWEKEESQRSFDALDWGDSD